jgi:SAM-dependent methyltransferase
MNEAGLPDGNRQISHIGPPGNSGFQPLRSNIATLSERRVSRRFLLRGRRVQSHCMSQQVRHSFHPRWYQIFSEPFFIIRRGLGSAVKRHAAQLSGSILDFGCGSKPYRGYFNVDEYIGLDIETEVSSSNPDLKADVFYDGKRIPFNEGRFDGVFTTEVLEHVFNPDEILPEINRVMKPGGLLLLTCPFFWQEHEQPYDYARYTSFGLKHLLQRHGFEVVNYEKTGSYFETILQGMVTYAYFFIPHKPKALEVLFFSIFITPWLALGLLLAKLLPRRIKRNDLYLNNVILARKVK